MRLLFNRLFVCLFVLVVCSSECALAGSATASVNREGFADIVDSVYDSVVNIFTTQKIKSRTFHEDGPFKEFEEFFERFRPFMEEPRERNVVSLGSGFVISADGLIVTNYHVIQDATEVVVRFNDGNTANAEIIGRDKKTDVAVLKVSVDRKLPFVKFTDSDKARIGEWVIAVGNPFGFGGSVSVGVISGRARRINAGPFDDFIQTDTAMNKGNSGGPLFNSKGEVVGVNTAIYSPSGASVGLGFAIPSNIASMVTDRLVRDGKVIRGWLGVRVQGLTDEMANYYNTDKKGGVLVAEVMPKSPAVKAGIKVGDILKEFNGRVIDDVASLPRIVAHTIVDTTVPIKLVREGKVMTLHAKITVNNQDDSDEETGSVGEESNSGGNNKGVSDLIDGAVLKEIKDVHLSILRSYGIVDKSGVLVLRVMPGSLAEKAGLREGCVIETANQIDVVDMGVIKSQIKSSRKNKRPLLLRVAYKNQSMFVAIAVK